MTGKLEGRIAVVTGAARGQGAATAKLLTAEGARVVLTDILEAEARETTNNLGSDAMFQRLDVSSEQEWEQLSAAINARWGACADILVNNAGMVQAAGIIDLNKADFERTLSINLIGPWLGIRTLAPGMISKGKGAIVNICSTAALWGMNGLCAYPSSKWALRGLTKTAAMELGHRGVRVNAVFPGGVNTIMTNTESLPLEELNRDYQNQPIQRIGEAEEIAKATLFLISDDASYLCGAEIAVDGGMTLGYFRASLPGGPELRK